MDNPLVSVIICFLNPGAWLEEAVESVLAQNYGNWELILVDDGSRSVESEVALKYAYQHPRKVTYADHADHRNIGLTASRNKGIALATGELVAFLDADDYWYEDKLYEQVKLFKDHPQTAMICEASRFWYSWNDRQANDPIIYIGAEEGLYQKGDLSSLLYPLGAGQPPCPSGIIVRKTALLRSGAFEELFSGVYQLYEDQAFLAKIYLNEIVYVSAACHNKYRKHGHSMSGAAADPVIYAKVRNFFLDWLSGYTQQSGTTCLDELIRKARLSSDGV